MKEISYVVNNTLGIHARPAASVSYTHLDVYKRQILVFMQELLLSIRLEL